MPVYNYVARDEKGIVVRGSQESVNEAAALSQLQNRGLFVTEISSTVAEISKATKSRMKRHRRIKSDDMLFFMQQSSNLMNAGIPFIRVMELIADQTESQKLFDILHEIMRNVRAGSTFKSAMARHPNAFPEFWLHLIEAGEVSGSLPMTLAQIARNLEANDRLKKRVVSALVYPIVLISASFLAIIAFMVFIIPTFQKVFAGFNAKLPPLTQMIIDISNFLRSYLVFAVAGAVFLFFFLKNYFKTPTGKLILDRVLIRIPIFGGVTRDLIHARLGIALALLLRNGVSFLKTLEITASITNNIYFENALNNIKQQVQQGKPFSASLKESPIFSPMFVNLVAIGEESGKLPDMVEKASEYYESRTEIFSQRVGVLIEPLVMLIVGGIIGVIVVAMFMPILSLSKVVR